MERKGLVDLIRSLNAERFVFMNRLRLMSRYPHRPLVITARIEPSEISLSSRRRKPGPYHPILDRNACRTPGTFPVRGNARTGVCSLVSVPGSSLPLAGNQRSRAFPSRQTSSAEFRERERNLSVADQPTEFLRRTGGRERSKSRFGNKPSNSGKSAGPTKASSDGRTNSTEHEYAESMEQTLDVPLGAWVEVTSPVKPAPEPPTPPYYLRMKAVALRISYQIPSECRQREVRRNYKEILGLRCFR